MKKLLGVLGAVGMVATSASTVVSCGNKGETDYKLDLTSKEYDTLGEIRAYIMSENGEGTEVGFFLSIDSAKTMYDAANKDTTELKRSKLLWMMALPLKKNMVQIHQFLTLKHLHILHHHLTTMMNLQILFTVQLQTLQNNY
jgi:hypothetical protein